MLDRVIKNIEEYDVDIIECPTLQNLDNIKLKTNNVIINLFDVMDFKNEELPLIQELFPNKNILVITPHKYGDDIEYIGIDFLWWDIYNEYDLEYDSNLKSTIQDGKYFLRPKKFISYNNSEKIHRTTLKEFLERKKFIDDGWFSYKAWNFDNDSVQLDSLGEFIPSGKINLGLHLTSYLSLCTETIFDSYDSLDNVFLSEKIYKCILGFQPFILLGQYNTLEMMKTNGFKTFGNIWDETYDVQKNHTDRLNSVLDSIEYILSKSRKEIHQLYYDNIDIMIHNYKHYFKYRKKHSEYVRKRIVEWIEMH